MTLQDSTLPAHALAVPASDLRNSMQAKGFSYGPGDLFSLYRNRVHLGDLEVFPTERGLELASIAVSDRFRNQGVGTIMLTKLCAVADDLRMPLRLTAVPIGSTGPDRMGLAAWYGKAGFVPIRMDAYGLRMGRRPVTDLTPRPDPDPVPEPF